eukprot:NODE_938_length_2926_cov_0.411390.p2 type:complete len:210 gc:universal NODE_938_length_2926_cov_0.411390:2182-2811(+)
MNEETERENVKNVYDNIASHFDHTRFAVWPVVEKFMNSLPTNTIGYDAGCGNGKYMKLRKDTYILGADNSIQLLKICVKKSLNVVYMNLHEQGIRMNSVDYIICIAVLHHLSNASRRLEVLKQFYSILKSGSKALVYVWAKEQPKFENSDTQDVMVPWHTEENKVIVTYQRYYHVFIKGELDDMVKKAGFSIENSGYDKGNWYVEAYKI